MLKDEFEIVFSLLRSRMKRVINYVNEVIRQSEIINNRLILNNILMKKINFDKINQNFYESEFEINPRNGWINIIDENLVGTQRYGGFIPELCM